MKLNKEILKEMVSKAIKKDPRLTLQKPAEEYEMAKRVFEQQANSKNPNENLQKASFNTMMSYSVFESEMLEEEIEEEAQQTQYVLEESIPTNPNKEVVARFFDSLYAGKRSGFLSYYSIEDLAQMHLYLIKGHNAGFALKGGNDIVSVHNNSSLKGLGKFFMKAAKEKGGTKLDHFDGFLSGLYRKNGFVNVYEVYQWEEQYKPSNWSYDVVDILNPKTSIYASSLNDHSVQSLLTMNEPIEIKAESNFKVVIVPSLKFNQYRYGRPDVVFRSL